VEQRAEEPTVSTWFLAVAGLFITCLLTANIIAVKLVTVFGWTLPASFVVFPISYICGDILTEVYGYGRARQVIWLGFLCNLIAVAAIWAGGALPPARLWLGQAAYEQILGFTPRLLAASFIAYLTGEFANSYVLAKMKIATNGRWLWTRTIGSTIVGEGLDSGVFITLAFIGVVPLPAIGGMILTQWLFKTAYETVVTPATYAAVGFLKKRERCDVYDRHTAFNPFRQFRRHREAV